MDKTYIAWFQGSLQGYDRVFLPESDASRANQRRPLEMNPVPNLPRGFNTGKSFQRSRFISISYIYLRQLIDGSFISDRSRLKYSLC